MVCPRSQNKPAGETGPDRRSPASHSIHSGPQASPLPWLPLLSATGPKGHCQAPRTVCAAGSMEGAVDRAFLPLGRRGRLRADGVSGPREAARLAQLPSCSLSALPRARNRVPKMFPQPTFLFIELSNINNVGAGLYFKIVTCHLGFGMDDRCLESSFCVREGGDSVKSLGSGNKCKIES